MTKLIGPVMIEIDGWPSDQRPHDVREAMKAAYRKRYGLPDDYEKRPLGVFGEFFAAMQDECEGLI